LTNKTKPAIIKKQTNEREEKQMKVTVMISKEVVVDINDERFDKWVDYWNNEHMANMEISIPLINNACKSIEEIIGLPFGSYNNEKTYISAVYDEDYNAILEY
jgi:hypothetical protein